MKRVTHTTIETLRVLCDATQRGEPVYGFAIIEATGIRAGTIYPILMRLERDRFVTSRWDNGAARRGPRRRVYKLTASGMQEATVLIAEYNSRRRR